MSKGLGAGYGRAEMTDSGWRKLYKAAGVAGLLAVIFFRRNFAVELVTFGGFGIFNVPETWPDNAQGWFALLQDNRLMGLVLYDGVDLVNYALVGVIFLALYGALRQADEAATVVATAAGLAGSVVYFASNQAFAMLSLSERYAAAATEAQRSALLAAGEALLAIHNPGAVYQGTGIYVSLLLVLLAGLIISVVMLRTTVFGRATAVTGILANGLGLGYFIILPAAPTLTWIPVSTSAPFRVIWIILIARRLFQLARAE